MVQIEKVFGLCNGKTATCNNFVWRYKQDPFNKYPIGTSVVNRTKHIESVKKYDVEGNLLNTYTSKDILLLYGKSGKCSVYDVCDGKKDYYKNSIWRYVTDDFNKYPIDRLKNKLEQKLKAKEKQNNKIEKSNKNIKIEKKEKVIKHNSGQFKTKMVNCYNKNDLFVKTYNSLTEGGNAVGLKNSYNITNVCNKKRKYAGGFKWFYANDPEQPDKTKIIKNN